MICAIIADIHGNSAALAAVIRDIDAQGIDDVVNLGDHFSGPLDAAGTADLLMARDFVSIRGNHDRWLIETAPEHMGRSDRSAFDQLSAEHLDWLRSLPATLHHRDAMFLCHGTPTSDNSYWLERVNPDGSVRSAQQDEIMAHMGDIDASLVLCGHSHIPRVLRMPSGQTLLNPGSVGCPAYDDDLPVFHMMQTGTPNASYAIAEQRGADWAVTFRSIPYDWDAMAQRATEANRPDWARAVATGWI